MVHQGIRRRNGTITRSRAARVDTTRLEVERLLRCPKACVEAKQITEVDKQETEEGGAG